MLNYKYNLNDIQQAQLCRYNSLYHFVPFISAFDGIEFSTENDSLLLISSIQVYNVYIDTSFENSMKFKYNKQISFIHKFILYYRV